MKNKLKIKKKIIQYLNLKINLNENFKLIGNENFDSISYMHLILFIEREYKISMDEVFEKNLRTLDKLIDYIYEKNLYDAKKSILLCVLFLIFLTISSISTRFVIPF